MRKKNIYQQELMHAWANKTPEGKRREKLYNAQYYAMNKQDWVRRKAERTATSMPKIQGDGPKATLTPKQIENVPTRLLSSSVNDKSVVPTSQDFKEVFDLVGTVGSAIKNGAAAVGRFVNKIFSKPVEVVKRETKNVIDDIKDIWKDAFTFKW